MKEEKIVRWGIIGCGAVTEKKSGPALQKAKNSQVVAVMRRHGELARDYGRRHRIAKWYDDATALIADTEVDAVYIATPPSSHLKYTLLAARAGKPVYVEKPMGLNYMECQQMIDVCKSNQVPLFCAYYRCALPRYLKVKTLLDDNAIGDIEGVSMRLFRPPSQRDLKGEKHWRVDPNIGGNGYFYDLGSHMIDLCKFLLGPIVEVRGYTQNLRQLYDADDFVAATFDFEGGYSGTGLWCFTAAERIDCSEIIGSQGKITYATFADDPIRLEIGGKVEEINLPHPEHVQQPLIQTIVDELLGKGNCPSTGETAALTSWVMDQILKN